MSAGFKTIALIGKYKSPEIAEPLLRLAHFIQTSGVKVLLDQLTATHVGSSPYDVMELEEIGRRADLAVVLGGDGTMLNIASTLAPYDVPLIGINQGRLGFLTDVSVDTMIETVGALLDGKYVTEERMLLRAEVYRDGNCEFTVLVLNDIALSKGVQGSMIEFEVAIDEQFVYGQRSDGLIVSTPTGSTAYALSSGGPILHPALRLIALVPVCPHALSNRPIVVSGDATIEIKMRDASDARVHFDSHSHWKLNNIDVVRIRRSRHTIRLLHPLGHSYYHMLREKLHWSETL